MKYAERAYIEGRDLTAIAVDLSWLNTFQSLECTFIDITDSACGYEAGQAREEVESFPCSKFAEGRNNFDRISRGRNGGTLAGRRNSCSN